MGSAVQLEPSNGDAAMKEQGKTPNEGDSKKAGDVMKRAIDRTVEAEKNRDNFGNEQGKHDAADELRRAAEKDTGKRVSH